jgi:threonine/homoserine/homoserine lactone efflux protein
MGYEKLASSVKTHTPLYDFVMFPEFAALLTFIAASVVILIVPGPSVTVIVANSLKSGVKAGLMSIAGTQAGLVILLALLALGLEAITTSLAWLFDWLRLAGGAYLVWLGYKLLRSDGDLGSVDDGEGSLRKDKSYFWQGFFVILSNPKVLLFFGAFLPQFISPEGHAGLQTLFLGLVFMVLATILDSLYAIAAGRVGALLTKRNVRAVEISGGSMMIGGGLWLALSRT